MSHHEILGLIAPFTRRGLRVDLARTDRGKRSLVFHVIEHADVDPALAGLREELRLENPAPNAYRLTRALALPCDLTATLRTDGPDPGALLARMDLIPVSRQFRQSAGAVIALSYLLRPSATAGDDGAAPARLALIRAEARLEGLALCLKDAAVGGYPADIDLVPQAGHVFDFPDDLLAVLGRGWGPLRRHRTGWSGHVSVRGAASERGRQLEQAVERMVAHLVATLAEPPARFHDAQRRARWGVALRRGTPLLVYTILLVGAGGMSFVKFPEGSVVPMILMSTPSLLMFGAFAIRNRPRLELPSPPRRLSPAAWRPVSAASVDGGGQPEG